jgi:response regulator RpfG family c-di-GMP phosphodiesterase
MHAEVAFAEIDKQKGKQFDPKAAVAFLTIQQRIIQEMQCETQKINMQHMGLLRLA